MSLFFTTPEEKARIESEMAAARSTGHVSMSNVATLSWQGQQAVFAAAAERARRHREQEEEERRRKSAIAAITYRRRETQARPAASHGAGSGASGLLVVGIIGIGLFSLFGGGSTPAVPNANASLPTRHSSASTPQSVPQPQPVKPSLEIARAPTGDFEFGADTPRTIGYDPVSGVISLYVSKLLFPLDGIEPNRRMQPEFLRSEGFLDFRDKVGGVQAPLRCIQRANMRFSCFWIARQPDGTEKKADISRTSISMGAALATADAPADYRNVELAARSSRRGNWQTMSASR